MATHADPLAAAVQKMTSRRQRWPDLKGWHRSRAGNLTISRDGYRVTIVPREGGWGGVIVHEASGEKAYTHRARADVAAAQLDAFDILTIWLRRAGKG